jgi:hypothetical protein
MGTRGAFGIIIGEKEKIGYNQFDSYPDGKGIENLRWLRSEIEAGHLQALRVAADKVRLVDDDTPPSASDISILSDATNLNVSEQSTTDWYCLTRETHGDIGAMIECGYIYDSHAFPLDSLFCEWAYIVDLDAEVFEVYRGFQKTLPKKGRWAGRPTAEEDRVAYEEQLKWCAEHGRGPWRPEVSEYKAVELVASYSFWLLPSDEAFLAFDRRLRDAEEAAYEAARQ